MAPVVISEPVTEARPGVAYSYTIVAEDMDGDALTYTAIVLPGWLDFNASTQTLAATPGEEDEGDQHVSIRISDGSLSIDHNFIISVSSANHAPTFTSEPETSVVVGEEYSYTVIAEDIDGDSLSYSAPQLPDWLTFNSEDHMISGVPDSGDLGRHDIALSVSDGIVSAEQNFPIFVEAINTAPSFISVPVTSVTVGEMYVYQAKAEDVDGDDLSFSAITLPGWLSFDIETHYLHGIPNSDEAGNHDVSLRVTDGEASVNQQFVISVELAIGIEDLSSGEGILIYPNPSYGRFFVELSKKLGSKISMEIMDPTGRILQQTEFPPYFLIYREYDLRYCSPGIYYIRISDESSQTLRKLIVN
jgi:hypothetical protein